MSPACRVLSWLPALWELSWRRRLGIAAFSKYASTKPTCFYAAPRLLGAASACYLCLFNRLPQTLWLTLKMTLKSSSDFPPMAIFIDHLLFIVMDL